MFRVLKGRCGLVSKDLLEQLEVGRVRVQNQTNNGGLE